MNTHTRLPLATMIIATVLVAGRLRRLHHQLPHLVRPADRSDKLSPATVSLALT